MLKKWLKMHVFGIRFLGGEVKVGKIESGQTSLISYRPKIDISKNRLSEQAARKADYQLSMDKLWPKIGANYKQIPLVYKNL